MRPDPLLGVGVASPRPSADLTLTPPRCPVETRAWAERPMQNGQNGQNTQKTRKDDCAEHPPGSGTDFDLMGERPRDAINWRPEVAPQKKNRLRAPGGRLVRQRVQVFCVFCAVCPFCVSRWKRAPVVVSAVHVSQHYRPDKS